MSRILDKLMGREEPSEEGYEHLTSEDRHHIKRLRRRAEHLDKRIEDSPIDLTYDKAEVAAIRWALGWIAAHK